MSNNYKRKYFLGTFKYALSSITDFSSLFISKNIEEAEKKVELNFLFDYDIKKLLKSMNFKQKVLITSCFNK